MVVRLKLRPTVGAFDGRNIPTTFLDDEVEEGEGEEEGEDRDR